MPANPQSESEASPVISPFSDRVSHTLPSQPSRTSVWIALALTLIAILSVGGLFAFRHLNDPYRTLEDFPVAKYLESYKALAGSKFRAGLRVENDLGWKEGAGRLMVFSLRDEPRPIVVMIPPDLASVYFTKGQTYEGELEVKEGGLIYANAIRKN